MPTLAVIYGDNDWASSVGTGDYIALRGDNDTGMAYAHDVGNGASGSLVADVRTKNAAINDEVWRLLA